MEEGRHGAGSLLLLLEVFTSGWSRAKPLQGPRLLRSGAICWMLTRRTVFAPTIDSATSIYVFVAAQS